jgi:hypothetical protein
MKPDACGIWWKRITGISSLLIFPQRNFKLCSLRSPVIRRRKSTLQEVRRIVETMCDTLGLSATDKLRIMGLAENSYPVLAGSLTEINCRIPALPDRYIGLMPYGNNIGCSTNFKMPQLFDEFKNELFMAGTNLAFLLDLKAGTANFKKMLEVLMKDERKKIKLCICAIWQEHIHYA